MPAKSSNMVSYHDMHNRYGEILTYAPLTSSPRALQLWTKYAADPPAVEHSYINLLLQYSKCFRYVVASEAPYFRMSLCSRI